MYILPEDRTPLRVSHRVPEKAPELRRGDASPLCSVSAVTHVTCIWYQQRDEMPALELLIVYE